MTGTPKNLGVDTFPDPLCHFGAPWRPFWILQAVRRCRRLASAPFAARLVLLRFLHLYHPWGVGVIAFVGVTDTVQNLWLLLVFLDREASKKWFLELQVCHSLHILYRMSNFLKCKFGKSFKVEISYRLVTLKQINYSIKDWFIIFSSDEIQAIWKLANHKSLPRILSPWHLLFSYIRLGSC